MVPITKPLPFKKNISAKTELCETRGLLRELLGLQEAGSSRCRLCHSKALGDGTGERTPEAWRGGRRRRGSVPRRKYVGKPGECRYYLVMTNS